MENPPQPNPQHNVEKPPQPNPQPNPKPKGEQYRNSHIIVHLASLRCLSSSIRGGDHLRESLAEKPKDLCTTLAHTENPRGNTTAMD